jgi:hypothetical protein
MNCLAGHCLRMGPRVVLLRRDCGPSSKLPRLLVSWNQVGVKLEATLASTADVSTVWTNRPRPQLGAQAPDQRAADAMTQARTGARRITG